MRIRKSLGFLAATAVMAAALVSVRVGRPCGPSRALASDNGAAPEAKWVTLTVEGMTCGSCSLAVRTAVQRLKGVHSADVDVKQKRAVVKYDGKKVTPEQIIAAINDLGYRASLAPAKSGP